MQRFSKLHFLLMNTRHVEFERKMSTGKVDNSLEFECLSYFQPLNVTQEIPKLGTLGTHLCRNHSRRKNKFRTSWHSEPARNSGNSEQFQPQRSKRRNPSTYSRKSTYIPLNVNKGESSTFFSLFQGNFLFQSSKINCDRGIAKMEKNGHSRWYPATIDALGDRWRQW